MSALASAIHRVCPVCQAGSERATLFFENNIDPEKLSSFSFSSRKTPEFMAHRLVQCLVCDLVYANQPPSEEELSHAYHVADYDSADEAHDAATAYMLAMQPALRSIAHKQRALEIGTGTGVLLELLRGAGFPEVIGVEPSTAAIAAAPSHRQAWIREGMFDERDFHPASLDLICCFMTMEHVRDPKVVADAAFRLLRPGGAFITVTHNYRSLVNRALGMHSPIIDIEHMQLFSDKSIRYLFETTGFVSVTAKAFTNTYALSYWMRLAPILGRVKALAVRFTKSVGWDRLKLSVNVGNTMAVGIKPAGPH
ncbi:MAG: class I SAM-dependent methyltransferase [Candidatus Saccharibacteria bacterium]|nr:class I SAM-dependent methyltransferase [Rhodoferax sp.]